MRRESRQVFAGTLPIGGGAPVAVQSMTDTRTSDAEATLGQIRLLSEYGAEMVRVAVPDREAAEALGHLVESSPVPLVADVHFDPELALASLERGVHKLRINPGNIRRTEDVHRIAEAAADRGVPIRIGVNSGSVPGDLRDRFGGVCEESLWAAADRHAGLLRETGFSDIVLSIKASDPMLTVRATRLAAARCDYPLHLGVTEAGTLLPGAVRSSVALAILLSEGIGDTIRVSLTAPPQRETQAAWEILSALELRHLFPRVVSCPTCARRRIDVSSIASDIQEHLAGRRGDYTVAVMGCEVNGPGEARDADIAVIGTPAGMLIFSGGENLGEIDSSGLLARLDEQIGLLLSEEGCK
jgi:(E)-4-hydroxy-3-methylbut-2-enyl-diphosphate synthase